MGGKESYFTFSANGNGIEKAIFEKKKTLSKHSIFMMVKLVT